MSRHGQDPTQEPIPLAREHLLRHADATGATVPLQLSASPIAPPPIGGGVARTYGESSGSGSGSTTVIGGYELPLMNTLVEKLTCGSCSRLLRNPFQLGCGDRICESCLEKMLRESSSPRCPIDNEPFTKDQCFKDIFAKREILALSTRCPSTLKRRDGCGWVGKVADVEEHEASCLYCDIKCTNAPLCQVKVERNRLAEHLERECAFRSIVCSFCGRTILANDMNTHQLEECTATPLPCPNNCSAPKMLRKMFKEHLTKCPLHIVGCYYAFAGCAFRGPRKDLPEHHSANMPYHLQLCSLGFQNLQREVGALKEQCAATEQRMEKFGGKFETMVAEVSEQALSRKEAATPSSASSVEGAVEDVEKNMDILMQQQRVMDKAMTTYDIQLNDLNMRCDLLEVKTCNGILVWKIADFMQRRREALSSQTPSLYSPPFYTSPCGYKMCARLYPNGDGQGSSTHLSIFFVVMRGEYDALLPWPFQQRVTIKLLDQSAPAGAEAARMDVVETFKPDPASSSFHRPMKTMNVATGCPLFMPLAELISKEKRYIRDDTIFIKVIVHPPGSRAPDFPMKVQ
eukprot:scpid38394/ scgid23320/ TNF receptor-associated factor 3; CD40 receptor-associated factor 1; TRAFAMN